FALDVAANLQEAKPATNSTGYVLEAIDSATFFAADYRPQWLIRGLVVRDQPGVVGGPRKGLKTSILEDLTVSLGSGAPFLGKFAVHKPARVMLLSGESGKYVIQQTGLRIAASKKGVDPAGLTVDWAFKLPQLARPADVAALKDGLHQYGSEVLII